MAFLEKYNVLTAKELNFAEFGHFLIRIKSDSVLSEYCSTSSMKTRTFSLTLKKFAGSHIDLKLINEIDAQRCSYCNEENVFAF